VPLRQGLTITGNANLTFNRAAGSVFRFGAGTDATPNTPTFTAVSPANFFIASRSSLAGALSTNVPVTQYDNSGVITTIANNKFVAHRLYFFTTPNMAIQYAQVEYASLDAAKLGAATEAYVVNPAALNGVLLGWWIVGKNATDLTNLATSYFMPYTIGGGGSGVSVGALLASNNLSDVANPIVALINLGGEATANKQNSLTVDGTATKYPTVDSVNAGLALKANNDPAQIIITTAVSIATDTLGNLGKTQKEKNVIIDNGVNAINITVNGGTNFLASYLKHGTGAITFIAGSGRSLALVDGTAVLNGALGSKATISSVGTKDYLSISNAV
jgi:hypothetical protein